MTTVSVAMCTHQGARYVADQLASVLSQSSPVDQIVISDDASRDGTIAVIEHVMSEWALASGRTPEFLLLSNEVPLGVTANFEQAISACTGDLIVLSDQDDVWRRDKVAVMKAAFDADDRLTIGI